MYGDTCEHSCPIHCVNCQNGSFCSQCERENWGVTCEKKCSTECLNKDCDKETGKCYDCDGMKHGDYCEQDCPSNCIDGRCDQNGTCLKGCKDLSFYGDQCDVACNSKIDHCVECEVTEQGGVECRTCSQGKYGIACESDCPENCTQCKDSSVCTQCKVGFTGMVCDSVCSVPDCTECGIDKTCIVCKPGKYGASCEFSCPECETCTLYTGSIDQAQCLTCRKGQHLIADSTGRHICIDCEVNCESCVAADNCTSCKDGYYGVMCGTKCPSSCQSCLSPTDCHNCKEGWAGAACQCNKRTCIVHGNLLDWCTSNGTCLKGCRNQYFGSSCESPCIRNCITCDQFTGQCKECEAGLYGVTCANSCNDRCAPKNSNGTSICRFQDGTCFSCESGWYGPRCDKPCNPFCLTGAGVYGCEADGTCLRCSGNKYGPLCELDCYPNCYSRREPSNCDKDDGLCYGCIDGYYGTLCNMTCSAGCHTSCERTSGRCDECSSGFYGKFCEERCASNCGRGVHSKKVICNR